MDTPFSAIGRVAALPGGRNPRRLALYWQDRLLLAEAEPGDCRALAEGDLVTFTLAAPDRFAAVTRLGGAKAAGDSSGTGAGGDALRWRSPGGLAGRMARLRLRHRALTAVRGWFDEEGFLEVDTPCLVRAPSPEPQFEPFGVGGEFLITSPEFQLKRMLVGGFERIYRLGPAFRRGEVGRLHNPEFTLLEWYRVGAGLDDLARDLESLLGALLPLAEALDGEGRLAVPADPFLAETLPAGESADARVKLTPPFRREPVAALFREQLGMEIAGIAGGRELREAARRAGLAGAADLPTDFERAFFVLWNRFEHRLGREAPLLVVDWPAPLASLARLKPEEPTVAERLELLVAGIELANGFAELTDPAEQRRRFERDLAERRARGLPVPPLDERFLGALAEGMPPAAGMALGFDRLVMLLAGAGSIAEVLPFAWDER